MALTASRPGRFTPSSSAQRPSASMIIFRLLGTIPRCRSVWVATHSSSTSSQAIGNTTDVNFDGSTTRTPFGASLACYIYNTQDARLSISAPSGCGNQGAEISKGVERPQESRVGGAWERGLPAATGRDPGDGCP